MSEEASGKKMLAELGYTWVPTTCGGEVRNQANDVIASIAVAEIRAWCNGVRHGLAALRSCIHVPSDEKGGPHEAHATPVASCPWCIVVRKDRELEALRKVIARLEKGKKRG